MAVRGTPTVARTSCIDTVDMQLRRLAQMKKPAWSARAAS